MKFLSIELCGFKRLSLNNIKRIKLTMTEVIQIILGRNGSGKSSILKELNALPAEPKRFSKNGYKIFEFKIGHDHYRVESRFSPSTKHSFIKNGELELNPGGTAAVQKDICKKVAGITSDIINVIMGLESFTDMSASRRRELFTSMCDTDYDYAIKLYNRINSALRDTSGAIKIAKKRLTAEAANVVTDEEYQTLRDHLEQLTLKSKELYQKKVSFAPTREQADQKARAIVSKINELSGIYKNTKSKLYRSVMWSPQEIREDTESLKEELIRSNALLNAFSEDYNELKNRIEGGIMDEEETQAIRKRIIFLSEQNASIEKAFKTNYKPLNPEQASLAMDMVFDRLQDVLLDLPDNTEQWYTEDKLTALQDQRDIESASAARAKDALSVLQDRLRAFEFQLNHDAIECPNCTHKFRQGYNENLHNEIKDRVQKGTAFLEERVKILAELDKKIEQLASYKAKLSVIREIVQKTPSLKEFWEDALDIESIRSKPAFIATLAQFYSEDLKGHKKLSKNIEELREIKSRLQVFESFNQKDIQKERDKLQATEDNITHITAKIGNINNSIARNNLYLRQLDSLESIGSKMGELKHQLDLAFEDLNSAVINDLIDKILTETHIEIANVSTKVSDLTARRALIEDIKQQISKLEKEEIAYSLLSDTLSPKDGLIAEGLLGFIRGFIAAMNVTINSIWSYKIKIQDCSTEADSADLNYRFPMEVEGDDEPRDDVKDGSSGMKEVINLAYRLVAMAHMGLGEYPLMIDEFGAFFDKEHKHRAPYAIKKISEQMSFEQIFIISHHDLEYTMFPKAQFLVLDKNNIALPNSITYNEHVEIE